MLHTLESILEAARATGELSSDQRLRIQRMAYSDGKIDHREADMLFAINDAVDVRACPEWPDVFVGAMTGFLLRHSVPHGFIDESEGAWLMSRIDADGKTKGDTEMALLLHVLSRAEGSPARLQAYALRQVTDPIKARGFATAEDTEKLRTVLYATGGTGGVGVSRVEAEILFEVADAVEAGTNDPSFGDLFVRAMANHLMMSAAPPQLRVDEALRRERFLESRGSAWGTVVEVFQGIFKPKATYGKIVEAAPSSAQGWLSPERLEAAEAVDSHEADWLRRRLEADGRRSATEQALLDFLREECPELHVSLRAA